MHSWVCGACYAVYFSFYSSFLYLLCLHLHNLRHSNPSSYLPIRTPCSCRYRVVVHETAAGGTVVANVTATDLDCGDTPNIVYSIVGGNDAGLFAVNSTTGIITLVSSSALDPVTTPSYYLTVAANDSAVPTSRSGTAFVQVDVVDDNNHDPVFNPPLGIAVSIVESNVTNVSVATVVATDSDLGANGQVRYSIVAGNDDGTFVIDSTTGSIRTATATCSDVVPRYSLTINASDRGDPPRSSQTVVNVTVIDVNNASPVFGQSAYNVSVSESTLSPHALLAITATDADCMDTPKITYRIVIGGGCGGTGGGCMFVINSSTGVLSLASPLDFETATSHSITVEASDNFATSPRTTTVPVTVFVTNAIDEAPRFTRSSFSVVLDEGDYINQHVHVLTASDADIGDTLAFALVGGGGGVFTVDSSSGNVSVTGSLCATEQNVYTANISVTDASNARDYATLTLTVRRVNAFAPQFRSVQYVNADILEGNPIGLVVAVVSADDADCGDANNLSYSIIGGDTTFFSVNRTSGVVTAARSFDRELNSQLRVVLQAMDSGSPPRTATTEVNVTVLDANDVVPAFLRAVYNVSVDEGSSVPRELLSLVASDGDATSPNNVVSYSITAGDNPTVANFAIDPSDGSFTLLQSVCAGDTPHFNITVAATDGGSPPLTGRTTVLVTVVPQNRHDPQFAASVFRRTIPENATVGSVLMELEATDADCPSSDTVMVFQLTDASDAYGTFVVRLDGLNRVVLNQTLDAETVSSFTVVAQVSQIGSCVIERVASCN